jgi:murein DD-endopeptidase MepM/ murein hydrolase activator NlpD
MSPTDRIGLALLPALIAACAAAGPVVLSPYRATLNPGGGARGGAHPAIDFGGRIGDPVLAAADGIVVGVYREGPHRPCGNGLHIWHSGFMRHTIYCQLAEVKVRPYDTVQRGQLVGLLGTSGEPSWSTRPIPMLHFGLHDSARPRHDGDLEGTFDPMDYMSGCFDPGKTYPGDRLVLTYPVRCTDKP